MDFEYIVIGTPTSPGSNRCSPLKRARNHWLNRLDSSRPCSPSISIKGSPGSLSNIKPGILSPNKANGKYEYSSPRPPTNKVPQNSGNDAPMHAGCRSGFDTQSGRIEKVGETENKRNRIETRHRNEDSGKGINRTESFTSFRTWTRVPVSPLCSLKLDLYNLYCQLGLRDEALHAIMRCTTPASLHILRSTLQRLSGSLQELFELCQKREFVVHKVLLVRELWLAEVCGLKPSRELSRECLLNNCRLSKTSLAMLLLELRLLTNQIVLCIVDIVGSMSQGRGSNQDIVFYPGLEIGEKGIILRPFKLKILPDELISGDELLALKKQDLLYRVMTENSLFPERTLLSGGSIMGLISEVDNQCKYVHSGMTLPTTRSESGESFGSSTFTPSPSQQSPKLSPRRHSLVVTTPTKPDFSSTTSTRLPTHDADLRRKYNCLSPLRKEQTDKVLKLLSFGFCIENSEGVGGYKIRVNKRSVPRHRVSSRDKLIDRSKDHNLRSNIVIASGVIDDLTIKNDKDQKQCPETIDTMTDIVDESEYTISYGYQDINPVLLHSVPSLRALATMLFLNNTLIQPTPSHLQLLDLLFGLLDESKKYFYDSCLNIVSESRTSAARGLAGFFLRDCRAPTNKSDLLLWKELKDCEERIEDTIYTERGMFVPSRKIDPLGICHYLYEYEQHETLIGMRLHSRNFPIEGTSVDESKDITYFVTQFTIVPPGSSVSFYPAMGGSGI